MQLEEDTMTLSHQMEEEEEEAFVGINEGEIADGEVLDDLNDGGNVCKRLLHLA